MEQEKKEKLKSSTIRTVNCITAKTQFQIVLLEIIAVTIMEIQREKWELVLIDNLYACT